MLAAGVIAVAVLLGVAPTAGATAGAVTARSDRSLARGIDISAYQHHGAPINWRRLRRDGIRFVMIKATEGTYYRNPYYRPDARDAAQAGLAVMPYVFANPSRAGGRATVGFAVRATGYRRGPTALPLVIDLENDPYTPHDCYRVGARRMVAWIAGFIRRARTLTGKRPVIYTTADWWRECTRSSGRFRRDPLWVAEYDTSRPAVPWPWHRWAFWQYKGDGFLPGVGRTDLDYFRPAGAFFSLHPRHKHKQAHPKKKKKHPRKKRKHKQKKHKKERKHPRKKPKKHRKAGKRKPGKR